MPGANRWLALLLAVYICNFLDRTLVSVLQQPIKEELALADWQLGLLGGTSFAVFYTLFGIWLARVAERGDRPRLLAGCVVAWSAFTALTGAVTSFVQLVLLRIGVAVGEAGAMPSSHSLIAEYYPPSKRAGALSIFSSGSTWGHMLGSLLGAVIGQAWGWRAAFVVAAVPGVVLAIATLVFLPEPRRSRPAAEQAPVPPVRAVLAALFARRTFRHLAIAAALTLFAAYATGAFVVPHLMRSFGASLRSAGLIGGALGGLMLALGTLGGGFAAQALAHRDRRWMMWLPGGAMLLAAPLCLAAFLGDSFALAAGAFLAMNLFVGTFQGPMFSTNHSFVPQRMRATASAILLLIFTLFGLGLGPLLAGVASDIVAARSFDGDFARECRAGASAAEACRAASAQGLRVALAACAAVFAWAGVHYLLAARTIRADVID